ncbi:MAG: type II toxin-antitoxin system VapC family toxin [Arachnia sp.]
MIIDANVLLYAVDSSSAHHRSAKDWLENALNGPGRIGIPWASLLAFQRIATHPRGSANPLSAAQAWEFILSWIAADQTWIPEPGPRHADILGRLLCDGDYRGNLVTDAHLAALAIENGVGLCSYDGDFARFPGLLWVRPA